MARDMGFNNINIDLMFAIPGQSLSQWMKNIEQAIILYPEHLSIYSLKFEEGTEFFHLLQQGKVKETDEIIDRKMYWEAMNKLKEYGYNQ